MCYAWHLYDSEARGRRRGHLKPTSTLSIYQALRDPESKCHRLLAILRRETYEYTRGVLAYHAGVRYSLGGLARAAKAYMPGLEKPVSIVDIIALARKMCPGVSECRWFSNHLAVTIKERFEADEESHRQGNAGAQWSWRGLLVCTKSVKGCVSLASDGGA
ncbi:hypothetical protein BJX76DRAFT_334882 [Aspergillus varians]